MLKTNVEKYKVFLRQCVRSITLPAILRLLKKVWAAIMSLADRADRHHIFLSASGIAFNLILFILPALLAILYIISFFGEEGTMRFVKTMLMAVLPESTMSEELVSVLLEETAATLDRVASIGWLSIPLLLWTASTLFASLRTALNTIFDIGEPGFFLKYKLKDMLMLLFFTFFVLFSGFFSAFLSLFEAFGSAIRDSFFFFVPEVFDTVFRAFLSLMISFLFFLFLYVYVPHKALAKRVTFTGAIICAILWESARFMYSWYIADIGSFGKLYGTYSFIAVTALWIYYAALVVLISGEIACQIFSKKLSERT